MYEIRNVDMTLPEADLHSKISDKLPLSHPHSNFHAFFFGNEPNIKLVPTFGVATPDIPGSAPDYKQRFSNSGAKSSDTIHYSILLLYNKCLIQAN